MNDEILRTSFETKTSIWIEGSAWRTRTHMPFGDRQVNTDPTVCGWLNGVATGTWRGFTDTEIAMA